MSVVVVRASIIQGCQGCFHHTTREYFRFTVFHNSKATTMSCMLPTPRLGYLASKNCPPVFLAPALSPYRQNPAFFSTSSPVAQRTTRSKHAPHPNRGVSALRRTGLRHRVEMDKYPLPVPVLDPEKRSKVAVDEKHGLWGFFRPDKKALNTPEETAAFGSATPVTEFRL